MDMTAELNALQKKYSKAPSVRTPHGTYMYTPETHAAIEKDLNAIKARAEAEGAGTKTASNEIFVEAFFDELSKIADGASENEGKPMPFMKKKKKEKEEKEEKEERGEKEGWGEKEEKEDETEEKEASELFFTGFFEKLAAGKWIQKAIKKPGALHKQLHVPEGEKIPAEKLEEAAESKGKLGQRARLAQTLKKLNRKNK